MKSCCHIDSIRWKFVAIVFATTLCVGCDSSSGDVSRLSGQVTLDGQPLPQGTLGSVMFQPAAGSGAKPASAEILNSRYDCPTAPNGKVTAQVSLSVPTGKTYTSDRTGQQVTETKLVELVPEQARGIEINVAGDTTFDLELKKN
jgi:hypothetical protein